MNLNLNCKGYEDYRISTRPMHGGVSNVFKFENNYGASVVKHRWSYGSHNDLWELAVICFDETGKWDLNYDTEITDDVVGFLTDDEVCALLERIKNLDEPKDDET